MMFEMFLAMGNREKTILVALRWLVFLRVETTSKGDFLKWFASALKDIMIAFQRYETPLTPELSPKIKK